ncbi:alpha/beta fold hydrolase [Catellatospora sp. NPDC049609]|uniref:alpha/beta hydrolase n=1 Tax=Catellatospora sp. NPDC049609 TaxID=3155505 RepID=UPI00341FAE5A
MRARYPDSEGFVERDGVKVAYEVHGSGATTILLAPTWAVVDSRVWKAQVAYLARHFRVITVDPRGNGRSDRPTRPEAYRDVEYAEDLVAVLDAVGVDRAVVVGLCSGAWFAVIAASRHPQRFLGLVAIPPAAPFLTAPLPHRVQFGFDDVLDSDEGWARYNRHYWRRDFRGFLEFFFAELLPEPHSTKQLEDCIEYGSQTDAETLLYEMETDCYVADRAGTEALLRTIGCPVLAVQGEQDRCQPLERSARFAELTGGELVVVPGGGHLLPVRAPVAVNRWIREFAERVAQPPARPAVRRWTRPLDRPRRLLYLSSPIGLGHARRDLAIADALRELRPGLRIEWLAQHPVTAMLRHRGEYVHPASDFLANESAHIEAEAGEHDLHAFQAIRRMDEILVANFMVFADLVDGEPYDAWVGDEAWELDYFLHENPELKRAAYVWLTDFVGWLPMPGGGPAEAALTADYNAEMVEQVARFPRLRDRSLFVGNPDDLVANPLGPGLPSIRDWTRQHFDFTGYITGSAPVDREQARAELGYLPDERVCVVAVGGSGVGSHLLRRVAAAYPLARAALPDLRMIVVAGPRIDPASLGVPAGVEVRGFVPDLHRHLAACDVAIVHGGLTTTMELTAAGTPFVYVPLRNHFEENFHVRHRLANYRAGRCLEYDELTPERIAQVLAEESARRGAYRPVETDGARRAAEMVAELL